MIIIRPSPEIVLISSKISLTKKQSLAMKTYFCIVSLLEFFISQGSIKQHSLAISIQILCNQLHDEQLTISNHKTGKCLQSKSDLSSIKLPSNAIVKIHSRYTIRRIFVRIVSSSSAICRNLQKLPKAEMLASGLNSNDLIKNSLVASTSKWNEELKDS